MTAQSATPTADAASSGKPKKPHILETLPSRARVTGAQAIARSRRIRRLRIALPALGAALVAVLIFNTRTRPTDQAFLNDFSDMTANPENLQMANPRFAGVDGEGRPYEITALSARQDPEAEKVVTLDHPRAVTSGRDKDTVVTAEKGVFLSEDNILELQEDVTLEHRIGPDVYVLRSPFATVSIDEKTVTTDGGVSGEGPGGGALQADRMRAYNEEGKIVFEGNVSMRIFPNKKKEQGDAASEPDKDRETDPQ
ncbi:MAG: LPS export ABC transporter periplasmic protein LptC [Parvularculaceae bacterium]